MQAEWLLALVEDLEKYSTTCVGAQCKVPAASGGSLMAWVDEMWKGRVIDATGRDSRNELMDQVCPDKNQFFHTPCGYPSQAQPDLFVKEEWFGLFAVKHSCNCGPGDNPKLCGEDMEAAGLLNADQLRASRGSV